MNKEKFEIEYLLKNVSLPVLWKAISTPTGLSEWFADKVSSDDNEYTFTWKKHDQKANLIAFKTYSFIRFQWEENADSELFFEFRMAANPLTNDLSLFVTDFAESGEKEDAILLWNHQTDQMKRANGF